MTLLNTFLNLVFLEWTYKFRNDYNRQKSQFVIKTILFKSFVDRLKLLISLDGYLKVLNIGNYRTICAIRYFVSICCEIVSLSKGGE